MAHILGASQHRIQYFMWKWSLLVTVVFRIQCGAVSEEDGQPGMRGIPEGCAQLILGIEFSNSSLQTQSLAEKERSMSQPSESQREILQRLNVYSATFTGRQGPFSASEGDTSQRAGVFPFWSISETGYNEVYFITLYLSLTKMGGDPVSLGYLVSDNSQHLEMESTIQGVFSNSTGRFCATFCAARSSEGRTRQHQNHYVKILGPNENHMTPAEFAYRAEHPESENVPRTLQQQDCDIHVELDFPKTTTMVNPFAGGVMTSLKSPDDPLYFHPLNISGISRAPYLYNETVQGEARTLGASAPSDISKDVHENLEVWSKHPPFCNDDNFHSVALYSPIWNSSCSSNEGELCSPFQNINISRIVSSSIQIEELHCTTDWKIRATFLFEFTQPVSSTPMVNNSAAMDLREFYLTAEGYWNFHKPGQLVMLASYFAKDGSPLDTRIQITLQIPMVRTLHYRYGIIGHVRSARRDSDPLYFLPFSFVGDFRPVRYIHGNNDAWSNFQLSYHYDKTIMSTIQPVCSAAADSSHKKFNRNARFPDGSRGSDLEVLPLSRTRGIIYQTSEGEWNTLQNLAIGQKFRVIGEPDELPNSSTRTRKKQIQGSSTADLKQIPVSFRDVQGIGRDRVEMEGYYDSTTGHMCMLGCRRSWKNVAAPYEDGVADMKSLNESCDLVYSIQYPPTNPGLWVKRPFVTGLITSLRDAGHPLYFKPVAFNSSISTNYNVHRRWTILRRNMETVLSLVSLSLTTFFVAIQVGYSTRLSNFRNLRFVSFVMLTVLTSGHFLLLVLGFKTFWNKTPTLVPVEFSALSGWPEAHDVILRGTSMVALLLELRLIQLVWRSRTRANSTPHLVTDISPPKVSEVRVLLVCLPAYVTLLIVVGWVHWQLGPHQHIVHYLKPASIWAFVWADVQAFSGVIVDLFLFPQVVANVLWDTQKNVAPLYPLFYVGVTTIRSAAHLFDAARAWNFIPEDSMFNFYARPNWDLYSTPWDIVIPCCSVALATVLFVQQRYGGRCFIPESRSRQTYQRVGSLNADL